MVLPHSSKHSYQLSLSLHNNGGESVYLFRFVRSLFLRRPLQNPASVNPQNRHPRRLRFHPKNRRSVLPRVGSAGPDLLAPVVIPLFPAAFPVHGPQSSAPRLQVPHPCSTRPRRARAKSLQARLDLAISGFAVTDLEPDGDMVFEEEALRAPVISGVERLKLLGSEG
ncbi:uncharacterized protein LOC131299768 [Rhododendron vialii]|uniref:uncharacterized protein LOC131299768 n=1 Tax=Rhododendron vialii TaxID=182163 RepID=UPI00265E3743|nr:uncharacterized protein LOC131299768 [Rhododendron vialii]